MELLHQILTASKHLNVFALDQQYKYLYFNPVHQQVMHKIWGCTIEKGTSMLAFISDQADCQRAKTNFDRALRGEEFSLTEEYGDVELDRHYYENFYAPLRDETGLITGLSVMVVDQSDRKRKQARSQHREGLLASISYNVQEGIFRSMTDHGLVFCNQALVDMFGFESMEDFIGDKGLSLFAHQDVRTRLMDLLKSEGTFANQQVEFKKKDGNTFWGLISASLVASSDGKTYFDGAVRDITDFKNAKDQASRSEERLKRAQAIGEMGDWEMHLPTGQIYWSENVYRILGRDPDRGTPTYEEHQAYYSESSWQTMQLSVSQAIEKGIPYDIELANKKQDQFHRVIGIPLAKRKKTHKLIGIIQDITKRKQYEINLKKNQQLLKSINQNVNEGIYRSGVNGGLIYVNNAFVKLFGFENQLETIHTPSRSLYANPSDREIIKQKLLKLKRVSNQECLFKRKDGSTFWGYMNAVISTDEDGNSIVDGAIRDITDIKVTQDGLKRQTEMQKILMNISKQFINIPFKKINAQLNDSLKLVGAFLSMERIYIFTYDFDRQICTNSHEWCAEGVAPQIANLQAVPLEKIPEWVEAHIHGKTFYVSNAEKKPYPSLGATLRSEDIKSLLTIPMLNAEKCLGFVGFDCVKSYHRFSPNEHDFLALFANLMSNIHVRIERQKERTILIKQLTDQNQRLKEYAFITSHHIRSSSSRIHALSDFLRKEPSNEDLWDKLDFSIDKLESTIAKTNLLLHIENDSIKKELKSYDLAAALDQVLSHFKQQIHQKAIHLEVEKPAHLYAYTLPSYIDSIFSNLISNAIQYGIRHHDRKIQISLSDHDHQVVFSISDQGVGMDLEKNGELLFKLGGRLHSDSDGQGLGLYMTKRQVEILEGKVEVASEPYKGTIFRVILPKI